MKRAFASQTQNFLRLHVSGFFFGTQDSSGNIGNRTCVVKRAKFISCSALREPGNEVPVLKTVYTVIVIMIMNMMMMMMMMMRIVIIIIVIIIIIIILKIFIQEVAITHGWFPDETCH